MLNEMILTITYEFEKSPAGLEWAQRANELTDRLHAAGHTGSEHDVFCLGWQAVNQVARAAFLMGWRLARNPDEILMLPLPE